MAIGCLLMAISSAAAPPPSDAAVASTTRSSPPALKDVLRRTGKAVEMFEQEFSAINCTEEVSQVKLGPAGKTLLQEQSSYDYLVMVHSAPDDLTVEESRELVKAPVEPKNAKKKAPLLVTDGFATLLLVFHPFFQDSYEYSQPEMDQLGGRPALKVEFRQIRGARSPSELRLREHDFPLEWQGTAWIDPISNVVLRIEAQLESSMDDVGLRSLSADVRYGPVRFGGDPTQHWLPETATIEAETPMQHWRNVHHFSNYKRFTVDTKSTVEGVH